MAGFVYGSNPDALAAMDRAWSQQRAVSSQQGLANLQQAAAFLQNLKQQQFANQFAEREFQQRGAAQRANIENARAIRALEERRLANIVGQQAVANRFAETELGQRATQAQLDRDNAIAIAQLRAAAATTEKEGMLERDRQWQAAQKEADREARRANELLGYRSRLMELISRMNEQEAPPEVFETLLQTIPDTEDNQDLRKIVLSNQQAASDKQRKDKELLSNFEKNVRARMLQAGEDVPERGWISRFLKGIAPKKFGIEAALFQSDEERRQAAEEAEGKRIMQEMDPKYLFLLDSGIFDTTTNAPPAQATPPPSAALPPPAAVPVPQMDTLTNAAALRSMRGGTPVAAPATQPSLSVPFTPVAPPAPTGQDARAAAMRSMFGGTGTQRGITTVTPPGMTSDELADLSFENFSIEEKREVIRRARELMSAVGPTGEPLHTQDTALKAAILAVSESRRMQQRGP